MSKIVPKQSLASLANIIASVIILLGVLFRLAQYAANRSLWLDEAALALNIVQRSFVGLTQPLDFNQGAPLGFLFLEKLVIQFVGNQDYILRAIPLIAGIFVLPLMYCIAARVLAVPGALLALGIVAFGEHLIYYASELKQYSSDTAIALTLYLIMIPYLEGKARSFLPLGIIGASALWFSHPALFVVGGIGIALVANYLRAQDWDHLKKMLPVIGLWLASFSVLYWVSLRNLAANADLLGYWGPAFVPFPPWEHLDWFANTFQRLFENPVGLSSLAIVNILLMLVGVISLTKRKWQWSVALFAPLLLTLLAAGLGKYPFGDRLMLFAVPLVAISLAEGVEYVRRVLQRRRWFAAIVWGILAGYLLFAPVMTAVERLQNPVWREEIRPLIAYLQTNRQADDSIYVYYGAQPAFDYYAPLYGFRTFDYIVGTRSRRNPDNYLVEMDGLRGRKRVWIIFSHVFNWSDLDERALILDHLNEIGKQEIEFQSPGSSLYLFDLDTGASD